MKKNNGDCLLTHHVDGLFLALIHDWQMAFERRENHSYLVCPWQVWLTHSLFLLFTSQGKKSQCLPSSLWVDGWVIYFFFFFFFFSSSSCFLFLFLFITLFTLFLSLHTTQLYLSHSLLSHEHVFIGHPSISSSQARKRQDTYSLPRNFLFFKSLFHALSFFSSFFFSSRIYFLSSFHSSFFFTPHIHALTLNTRSPNTYSHTLIHILTAEMTSGRPVFTIIGKWTSPFTILRINPHLAYCLEHSYADSSTRHPEQQRHKKHINTTPVLMQCLSNLYPPPLYFFFMPPFSHQPTDQPPTCKPNMIAQK